MYRHDICELKVFFYRCYVVIKLNHSIMCCILSLSYTDWGPIFGGVCARALLRNREWNKRNFFVER